jgi:hypothetical protein
MLMMMANGRLFYLQKFTCCAITIIILIFNIVIMVYPGRY